MTASLTWKATASVLPDALRKLALKQYSRPDKQNFERRRRSERRLEQKQQGDDKKGPAGEEETVGNPYEPTSLSCSQHLTISNRGRSRRDAQANSRHPRLTTSIFPTAQSRCRSSPRQDGPETGPREKDQEAGEQSIHPQPRQLAPGSIFPTFEEARARWQQQWGQQRRRTTGQRWRRRQRQQHPQEQPCSRRRSSSRNSRREHSDGRNSQHNTNHHERNDISPSSSCSASTTDLQAQVRPRQRQSGSHLQRLALHGYSTAGHRGLDDSGHGAPDLGHDGFHGPRAG